MKKSGLEHQIRRCTFGEFRDEEPWQKEMKAAAKAYAKQPEGWFYAAGQSGAGKTHLCTAICRELLQQGREVVYMLWRDEIVRLKGAVMEADRYGRLMDRYKHAEVLYIDDLFKTGKGRDGQTPQPSAADIHTAFEILNYRYCDPSSLTIVSSELTPQELVEVDEALAGRVMERANIFTVEKDRGKNWRLRGQAQ
jgi:DNA replication protein DnaC